MRPAREWFIVELSQKMLGDFERVTIKPQQATAEKVEQGVYFVSKNNKPKLLIHLLDQRPDDSVLVFSRTKHGANKIVKTLDKAQIKSAAIHGNKSQAQRQKALPQVKLRCHRLSPAETGNRSAFLCRHSPPAAT